MSATPTFYIFAGLPGTGKTTLARVLAKHYEAVYLRLDTIEHELKDLSNVKGEGHCISYAVAYDNLLLGTDVIFDSCNTIQITRDQLEATAEKAHARYVNIEVLCSDAEEHRARVVERNDNIVGRRLPTWEEVQERYYEPWVKEHVVIDTANKSIKDCVSELLSQLGSS